LDDRRPAPEHPEDSRIVAIDLASGTMSDLPVGHGVNFNPSLLAGDVVGFIRKDGADARHSLLRWSPLVPPATFAPPHGRPTAARSFSIGGSRFNANRM
jgi:hypothetical protein